MSSVLYYAALRGLGSGGAGSTQPTNESSNQAKSEETTSNDKPKVSKNQAKNDKKKAKKAAAAEGTATPAPAAAEKKPAAKKGQQQEEEIPASQYFQLRNTAIQNYTSKANTSAYPHKFNVQSTLPEFIANWKHLENSQVSEEIVSVAGRIFRIRSSGAALFFIDIQGDGEKLQVFANRSQFHNADAFAEITTLLRRGDVIGITGNPTRTKAGELSIIPRTNLQLLSPCLHSIPFPDTLKSLETRFRNRYLDLIVNSQTRKTFLTRSRIITFLRRYFDERGFVEVETPMMDLKAGGAAAKPFKTYHNDLHTELYMRIAPELYLKQCIVGGIDKVYEIGRQFRNEGIDLTHYPEFTSMEFYWAYADYHDLMTLTEHLLSTLVKTITGGYVIKYNVPTNNEDGTVTINTKTIDFTPPFARISIIEKLESIPEIGKLPKDLFSDEANQFLINKIKELEIDMKPPFSTMRLIDKLVGEYIEIHCMNPTFLMDHPQVMSPLAKGHREKEGMTERFELFVNERELCNAYTELNDPKIQRDRFEAQMKDKIKLNDEEAQELDEVFIHALEIGLPPTAGWGMGIDRLAMLLTDSHNIKEVLLFPAMKDGSALEEENNNNNNNNNTVQKQ
eukprot:TRINITY_DN3590_c1_g2_i1.p1 TRINITY_DN3590_c1_g2~~TRINITY_DN3590_c1_g2_i1.p1  ORF type:complete len:621 (-),score=192.91 TRINITY_DN3590_c1_g2_i1:39-1901(-)